MMNNEERYYVPQIEELCYGFEVEAYYQDDRKMAVTGNLGWHSIFLDKNMLTKAWSLVKSGKLRVKRLDREDIESLGWGFVKNGATLFGAIPTEIFSLKEYTLELCKGWVNIDEGDYSYVFKGQIANKHELKVVMKMLGI